MCPHQTEWRCFAAADTLGKSSWVDVGVQAQRDQVSEICGLLRKHGKMLEAGSRESRVKELPQFFRSEGSKLKEQIPEVL